MILLSTAYLAPVDYYRLLTQTGPFGIETAEHYVKQSYRNRCIIASANGLQTLSIPVVKPDPDRRSIRDIRIADHGDWRRLHWNALQAAYRSSPFYEYYADDFRPFYEKKIPFLLDFNEQLRELICSLLDIAPAVTWTTGYAALPSPHEQDFREAIHPKKPPVFRDFKPYFQVFEHKYGFQPHLSIVDLLFNMGPESLFVLHAGI